MNEMIKNPVHVVEQEGGFQITSSKSVGADICIETFQIFPSNSSINNFPPGVLQFKFNTPKSAPMTPFSPEPAPIMALFPPRMCDSEIGLVRHPTLL